MTTERKPVRTDVTPADMDPQGNVVVWDHGPSDGDADAQAWHDKYGRGPIPITMHASDAGHAITVDPDRYALEPIDLEDGEIEAEVKAIQERRAEAEKFAADQKAEVQYMADRKVAIATLMARRLAAANEEPAPPPDRPPPEPDPVPPAPLPAPQPRTTAGVHRAAEENQP